MTAGRMRAFLTSQIIKRSLVLRGHKTSVSLENVFWSALKEIAGERGASLAELVAEIDSHRSSSNLSSSIRVYVLEHFRRSGTADNEAD